MYFKTAPFLLRTLLPSNLEWEIATSKKEIFLTFDDGPIPKVTPWVLEQLDARNVKATFFCVGDNVRKHPDIFSGLIQGGHSVGNHSFNHIQAWHTSYDLYLENVKQCNQLVNSTLFRPPHGQITPRLSRQLGKEYRLIMWSLLSRDFDKKVSPDECLDTLTKLTKPGSIVVFHDSLKAWDRLEYALPRFLDHFLKEGYTFSTVG
jgi:peptidoglycan-N-acetylglucosamine deacetylase